MEYCDFGMRFLLQWNFDNMDICGDAPWHVRTGVGFWMGVYDNWYFFCVGRCAHRPYIRLEKYWDLVWDFVAMGLDNNFLW